MNVERTFAYVKPDAMEAGHLGHVLTRAETEGFVIERMALWRFTDTAVAQLYAEHLGKPFYEDLHAFTTSGPVVLLVLAREDAVAYWRKVLGATDPRKAVLEGTLDAAGGMRPSLRALYGNQDGVTCRNVAHGSANATDAARELALVEAWLSPYPSPGERSADYVTRTAPGDAIPEGYANQVWLSAGGRRGKWADPHNSGIQSAP